MPIRPSPHPTEAELEILNVLWRHGPSTVRQVHEALQADRDTGLTTTLKMMQIMIEKGLLLRDKARPHRYSAATAEEDTQAGLLDDLMQKAFDGSMQKLLIRAVQHGKLSRDELEEMQQLIDNCRKAGRR